MNNHLMHLKLSQESGWEESQHIYKQALEVNGEDAARTNSDLFEYLKSGPGSAYLFSHVDSDLGSRWERLSKKWLSFIYTLEEVRIPTLVIWFISMLSNTTFYILDIVKDSRFIIFILIALLPESFYLVIISVGSLIVNEGAKMIQLYNRPGKLTSKKLMGIVFSIVLPAYLHHSEFMANIQLKKLAAIKRRSKDEEAEFIKVRKLLHNVLLEKAQLRATENVLEHFPQIIISTSVLTLEGAVKQLELTEGKKLFFILSLTLSLISVVRGQINLISARKNGQLGILAKLFLAIYLIIAIIPRMYAFTALLNGREAYLAFSVLSLVFLLHTGLSYVIQKKIFQQREQKFMQALWTFLTPPLFLDWDTLYRQQVGKMSIQECWTRTKYVILGHNILTLIGNIALGHKVTKPILELGVSSGIDDIIKLAIMMLSQMTLLALSYCYLKTRHPWARILRAELLKGSFDQGGKCNSSPVLKPTESANNTLKQSKSEHLHRISDLESDYPQKSANSSPILNPTESANKTSKQSKSEHLHRNSVLESDNYQKSAMVDSSTQTRTNLLFHSIND